ncbi:MAG TPA: 3-oxoacyl-ACP reductase family protein [Vicinamibacterales bacterium]|jgi:NAD(P)-dependent dehydrogenase (short-subunit alcohol dehydrogenase family)|nr:3-oxoacyl-ACP reductase family protein [Vicinamibacterales bacterium]
MTVLDQFKLTGKTALVTGGARGLGKTMASALAEAGANVAVTGRTLDSLKSTATEIADATGRTVRAFAGDVTSAPDVERLLMEVTTAFGGVDILINNAGTNIRGTLDQLSEADWDSVIDTNLKGPFLCTKAFAPGMIKKGWGRVINLASIMSVVALPGRTPYASSKAGVLGLTRVWALEWADKGVTCNAICPGPFATDMNRQLLNDPKAYQQFVANIPMGRWGELPELTGAVVFLASDASSFVTGTSLFVDGGWTAR